MDVHSKVICQISQLCLGRDELAAGGNELLQMVEREPVAAGCGGVGAQAVPYAIADGGDLNFGHAGSSRVLTQCQPNSMPEKGERISDFPYR
jgi:hypothetical protein